MQRIRAVISQCAVPAPALALRAAGHGLLLWAGQRTPQPYQVVHPTHRMAQCTRHAPVRLRARTPAAEGALAVSMPA